MMTTSPDEFARATEALVSHRGTSRTMTRAKILATSGFSIVLGVGTLLLVAVALQLRAQDTQRSAADALQHALHLADLYNWADAAPDFIEAEKGFLAAGDQRNALYARLGKIRATASTEQRALPQIAAQLASELDANPLLQTDKQLRMFFLIVKGDIDGEINGTAMRQDWEQVQALALDLGDTKWQYRSLAQLGIAAFYDGDLATARKNVGSALAAATKAADIGAQIRYLTVLGIGLSNSKMHEQALPYFDGALKLASKVPETGYPFLISQARLIALIGLGQLEAAQRLADDILMHARQKQAPLTEALTLNHIAVIARARKDDQTAILVLEQSLVLCEAGGFVRQLGEAQSLLADIYREHGDLQKAEQFAKLAANSTQESGDSWAVPQRLHALAQLLTSRGEYAEADRVYRQAAAFVDSLIGNFSTVLEKTAVIKASSEIYTQHFALVADRFKDPAKAYAIIEQVRGRITTDLLMAGSVRSTEAKKAEQTVAELRLKLMAAHSATEVSRLRDQIFMVEQARWVNPEISILKAQSYEAVSITTVQDMLSASAVILEYVVAEPRSYCLMISAKASRIVPLVGRSRLEKLVAAYLKTVKAKQPAPTEARDLYDALLRPMPEVARARYLVVIRDGPLHLVPFDGLMDGASHYIAEAHTVAYVPSTTAFYLLAKQKRRPQNFSRTLLAVGGVPYDPDKVRQASLTRGYEVGGLSDLPASREEVLAAEAAVPDRNNTILLGPRATESAFKRADLTQYRIVHLAVHGFANLVYPHRAALVLLSDPARGEDGFLQASEIVQLRTNAEVIILSACDTAVGPVEGEEGIATLARAFLLAGAKAVVSTLWAIDDAFSLALMKQLYKGLAAHQPPAYALAAAKREMLRQLGPEAVPYYWAGFTFEGVAGGAIR